MLIKILKLVVLTIILSACATRNCKQVQLDLPTIPLAGDKVADELSKLCQPADKCLHINTWLNELYLTKLQLEAYKLSD